ncbi:hypothetical protein [Streptomyces sp. NPDC002588]|uniref:hypothetical protein n=1 Tax=Streptomyces sp. NPDC002588 TaxID=3154419 RepID=UPI0033325116
MTDSPAMPAVPLSHGAPLLADDPSWHDQLAALSADMPRPKAILMVSAHREEADWGRRALETGDLDALVDLRHKAPAARFAHPRTEHFAPLFVTLGAGHEELGDQRTVIDGFWFGMAKRSVRIG